jgi:hypothetical protein
LLVRDAVFAGALKARCTPSRPPHPASNVRDDREPPLQRKQDAGRETWISEKWKRNIFELGGWTGEIRLKLLGKIGLLAQLSFGVIFAKRRGAGGRLVRTASMPNPSVS